MYFWWCSWYVEETYSVRSVAGDFKSTGARSMPKLFSLFCKKAHFFNFKKYSGFLKEAEVTFCMFNMLEQCVQKDYHVVKIDEHGLPFGGEQYNILDTTRCRGGAF